MTTSSFFTDLVIDTPEAQANLEELVRSGVTWKRGDSVIVFADLNGELARRIEEHYCKKQRPLTEGNEPDLADSAHATPDESDVSSGRTGYELDCPRLK